MATETTKLTFVEGAAASTPAASRTVIYAKADGLMYSKDDAGSETLMSAGSAGIPATIVDAKGDIIAATAADTVARLAAGANNTILMAASGETTGLKWHALTTVDATIGADVTMTTAGTYYDGPSASFIAGTWLIWYKLLFVVNSGPVTYAVKLWESAGPTIYDEIEGTGTTSGYRLEYGGFGLVTLGSTTTVKASAKGDVNGQTISRNGGSGTSNTTTRMTGIRIA